MPSDVAAIKSGIKARMVIASGIDPATVHTRRRNFGGQNDDYFNDLFVTSDSGSAKLNGWEIEHESGTSEWLATNKTWDRRDTFVIHGYYGVDDENNSEAVFSELVERVILEINSDQTLGATTRTHGTVQFRKYGFAMLGGKLCHHAELALTAVWAQEK